MPNAFKWQYFALLLSSIKYEQLSNSIALEILYYEGGDDVYFNSIHYCASDLFKGEFKLEGSNQRNNSSLIHGNCWEEIFRI